MREKVNQRVFIKGKKESCGCCYFDVRRVPLGVAIGFALESGRVKLALHHVEENGNCGFAQFRLGQQRHFQELAHHGRHEINLVLAEIKPHGTDFKAHLASHVSVPVIIHTSLLAFFKIYNQYHFTWPALGVASSEWTTPTAAPVDTHTCDDKNEMNWALPS